MPTAENNYEVTLNQLQCTINTYELVCRSHLIDSSSNPIQPYYNLKGETTLSSWYAQKMTTRDSLKLQCHSKQDDDALVRKHNAGKLVIDIITQILQLRFV